MSMNSLLSEIYRTGIVTSAEGEEIQAFPAGVDRQLAEALYRLVRESKAKRTLEIGMAYGISSLAICQGLKDNGGGWHVAIDPNQSIGYKSIGKLNLQRINFADSFELYEEPSHLALPNLLRQGRTFDLVFIDGMHMFDYIILDFFYSLRLVPVGGYIFMDDICYPGLKSAFAFICRNFKNIVSSVMITGRFCILQKIGEDNRDWQYYKPFESFFSEDD